MLAGPLDWNRLVFNGGGIGDLSQPTPPADTPIDEPTPKELLKARQLLDQGPEPSFEDTRAPQTSFTRRPKRRLAGARAQYRFASSEPGSSFRCKLDRGRFKPCRSPKRLRHLAPGRHRFRVRAIDVWGNVDPTPAQHSFKVR
jgi:hypothetical protein